MLSVKYLFMKNFEVQVLLSGLQQVKEVKLPGKISLAIIKNINKLADCQKNLEEVRKKLIEQYCEKDENGQPILEGEGEVKSYKMADIDSFNNEYVSVMEQDADLVLDKISEQDVEKVDGLTLEQMTYLFELTK